ncbi:uncharacterized protein LOC113552445 [Rhopalosiphum maidis]|uniref:uncharacterized protein LOC113552445 n=1 Tax=Rhopalosiphum maidis TaxID=43146 RepID=UPI000EFE23C1|nr:uncharacterized protein LOC113552445 [Rhopalosiphum maidis]
MSLKMNYLLISIVVLTIFVTLIPAVVNDTKSTDSNDENHETSDEYDSDFDDELEYNYMKKTDQTNEEDIMSASLLYFKEIFEDYLLSGKELHLIKILNLLS